MKQRKRRVESGTVVDGCGAILFLGFLLGAPVHADYRPLPPENEF